MFDELSIFQSHQDFLLNIHKNKEEKLSELFRLINHEKVDISDYDNFKKITHLIEENSPYACIGVFAEIVIPVKTGI